jgi:ABC-2 type transport system ATP-binding protein
MLCGLLEPSQGEMALAGQAGGFRSREVRQRLGYMSQKFSLYGDLTVKENLRFFAGLYHVPHGELAQRMNEAIAMAALEGREDALVRTLAGGWKQRLALGCAILHRPPVLFLDEPTSGVEPEARRLFWDLIHNMAADGVTILVSTHYMDEAEYCSRIALIDAGKLVAIGSPGQLRGRELGGDLYELDCGALGAGLATLRQAPDVVDAAIFGDKLHVLMRQGATDAGNLTSLLQQHGITAGPPRAIPPSLEDVFVQLVSRGHGDQAQT